MKPQSEWTADDYRKEIDRLAVLVEATERRNAEVQQNIARLEGHVAGLRMVESILADTSRNPDHAAV